MASHYSGPVSRPALGSHTLAHTHPRNAAKLPFPFRQAVRDRSPASAQVYHHGFPQEGITGVVTPDPDLSCLVLSSSPASARSFARSLARSPEPRSRSCTPTRAHTHAHTAHSTYRLTRPSQSISQIRKSLCTNGRLAAFPVKYTPRIPLPLSSLQTNERGPRRLNITVSAAAAQEVARALSPSAPRPDREAAVTRRHRGCRRYRLTSIGPGLSF